MLPYASYEGVWKVEVQLQSFLNADVRGFGAHSSSQAVCTGVSIASNTHSVDYHFHIVPR